MKKKTVHPSAVDGYILLFNTLTAITYVFVLQDLFSFETVPWTIIEIFHRITIRYNAYKCHSLSHRMHQDTCRAALAARQAQANKFSLFMSLINTHS